MASIAIAISRFHDGVASTARRTVRTGLDVVPAIVSPTNRLATQQLSGNYESVFKGQGLSFREVREYQPGDDVRAIDWNVSARMDHPFVKVFVEEREMTVMLLVDCSASQTFGTRLQPSINV